MAAADRVGAAKRAGTASSVLSDAMSWSRCGWSWRRPSTTALNAGRRLLDFIPVFSASWFDGGYIFALVYVGCFCFWFGGSMPLLCRSCSLPVVVPSKCPWFRSLQNFVELPQLQFLHGCGVASLCSCSEVLCAVAHQGPRILLDFLRTSGGVRSWC